MVCWGKNSRKCQGCNVSFLNWQTRGGTLYLFLDCYFCRLIRYHFSRFYIMMHIKILDTQCPTQNHGIVYVRSYLQKHFKNPAETPLRVVISTIGLGMGADLRHVKTDTHAGPPQNIEGKPIYSSRFISHTSGKLTSTKYDMKSFPRISLWKSIVKLFFYC